MSGQRHGDHQARGVPVQLGDATLASLQPVGVTDMLSPEDTMFGSELLRAAMQTASQESADTMCDAVVHALKAFQGSAAQADDITLLVAHHTTGAPSSNADRSLPGTS